jgi:four helix bundle protein
MFLNSAVAAPAASVTLDPHRLDVYALALAFQGRATTLVPERGCAYLRDQLLRASLSIVLNVAEGAGRFSRPDNARF